MGRTAATPRGSQGSLCNQGAVSGYLFKLVRESLGLTQVELAERLRIDVTTVQSWESGRRPLTALRAGDLVKLRMSLVRLGASPKTFSVLSDAIEADLLIADAVAVGAHVVPADQHPLATCVHRRDLTNLITWPLTGVVPTQLAHIANQQVPRRGPVADRPILSHDDRARLFDHLLVTADAHRDERNVLLRRQAIYLLGFDTRSTSTAWLANEQLRAIRHARMTDHVPSWVAVRSSAIALARNGDRDPLQVFVSTALTNDTQDVANLNYWAYWIGEIPDVQADDSFMVTMRPDRWVGARLFNHLVNRLRPGSLHAELNIHTLWALLAARPTVLTLDANVRAAAKAKIEHTVEDPSLTAQARHKLASVAYAIRLAER